MSTLSYAQLEGLWIRNGGDRNLAPLMAAIAEAESSGRTDNVNPSDNGGTQSSFGLWQISTGTHTPPDPNWNDPDVNARLAIGKLRSQGLTAWGTYTSGAYKRYLNSSTTPMDPGTITVSPVGLGDAPTADQQASAVDDTCAWSMNLFVGRSCLLSKSAVRAILGVSVLSTAVVIGLVGATVLVAYGLKRTGALDRVASATALVPGVGVGTRVAATAVRGRLGGS